MKSASQTNQGNRAPVNGAKEAARQAVCAAHLRQAEIALRAHTTDHRSYLPPGMAPTLPNLYETLGIQMGLTDNNGNNAAFGKRDETDMHCPSVERHTNNNLNDETKYSYGFGMTHWQHNSPFKQCELSGDPARTNLDAWTNHRYFGFQRITPFASAETLFILDGSHWQKKFLPAWNIINPTEYDRRRIHTGFRHGGSIDPKNGNTRGNSANVAYMDGHVALVPETWLIATFQEDISDGNNTKNRLTKFINNNQ